MVLAVLAENLPQVHKALEGLAAVPEISHWYDEPQTTTQPVSEGTAIDATACEAVRGTLGGKRPSLINEILRLASHKDGVSRAFLKEAAAGYDPPFNVGSISPTLVKLCKEKKLKRVSKGVYAAATKK